MLDKTLRKIKRHAKIRAHISGNQARPRLVVHRSSKHIYGMLVDDTKGNTLLRVSDAKINQKKLTKVEKAKEVGKLLASEAAKTKIKKVVFDRAGYFYHGRVKALAEGAREGGLEF